MKILSDKINESLQESHADICENIDSLIDIIKTLYTDYFTNDIDTFEIERNSTDDIIKYQISFQNNLTDFDSFKEAVISTIDDYNNKMKSMGQDEISATWKLNNQSNILELF